MDFPRRLGCLAVIVSLTLTGCISRNDPGTPAELRTLLLRSKWKSESTLRLTVPKGTRMKREEGMDFDLFYVTLRKPRQATLMIYCGSAPGERSRRIKSGLVLSTNQIGRTSTIWKTWSVQEELKSETIINSWDVTPPNLPDEPRPSRRSSLLHLLITAPTAEEIAEFQEYCRSLEVSYYSGRDE